MSHTPGPWFTEVGAGAYINVTTEAGRHLAKASGNLNNIKNALLMAAAPDLLAACESLVDTLAHIERNDPCVKDNVVTPKVLARAQAAIGKAKGEANV
jgi:hypothetical protein